MEFSIGDRATVESRNGEVLMIATVTKVGKRKLTLDSNHWKEWRADGFKPYGNKDSWYTGPSVRAYRRGDEKLFQDALDFQKVRGFADWRAMNPECIHEVADIIRRHQRGSAATRKP